MICVSGVALATPSVPISKGNAEVFTQLSKAQNVTLLRNFEALSRALPEAGASHEAGALIRSLREAIERGDDALALTVRTQIETRMTIETVRAGLTQAREYLDQQGFNFGPLKERIENSLKNLNGPVNPEHAAEEFLTIDQALRYHQKIPAMIEAYRKMPLYDRHVEEEFWLFETELTKYGDAATIARFEELLSRRPAIVTHFMISLLPLGETASEIYRGDFHVSTLLMDAVFVFPAAKLLRTAVKGAKLGAEVAKAATIAKQLETAIELYDDFVRSTRAGKAFRTYELVARQVRAPLMVGYLGYSTAELAASMYQNPNGWTGFWGVMHVLFLRLAYVELRANLHFYERLHQVAVENGYRSVWSALRVQAQKQRFGYAVIRDAEGNYVVELVEGKSWSRASPAGKRAAVLESGRDANIIPIRQPIPREIERVDVVGQQIEVGLKATGTGGSTVPALINPNLSKPILALTAGGNGQGGGNGDEGKVVPLKRPERGEDHASEEYKGPPEVPRGPGGTEPPFVPPQGYGTPMFEKFWEWYKTLGQRPQDQRVRQFVDNFRLKDRNIQRNRSVTTQRIRTDLRHLEGDLTVASGLITNTQTHRVRHFRLEIRETISRGLQLHQAAYFEWTGENVIVHLREFSPNIPATLLKNIDAETVNAANWVSDLLRQGASRMAAPRLAYAHAVSSALLRSAKQGNHPFTIERLSQTLNEILSALPAEVQSLQRQERFAEILALTHLSRSASEHLSETYDQLLQSLEELSPEDAGIFARAVHYEAFMAGEWVEQAAGISSTAILNPNQYERILTIDALHQHLIRQGVVPVWIAKGAENSPRPGQNFDFYAMTLAKEMESLPGEARVRLAKSRVFDGRAGHAFSRIINTWNTIRNRFVVSGRSVRPNMDLNVTVYVDVITPHRWVLLVEQPWRFLVFEFNDADQSCRTYTFDRDERLRRYKLTNRALMGRVLEESYREGTMLQNGAFDEKTQRDLTLSLGTSREGALSTPREIDYIENQLTFAAYPRETSFKQLDFSNMRAAVLEAFPQATLRYDYAKDWKRAPNGDHQPFKYTGWFVGRKSTAKDYQQLASSIRNADSLTVIENSAQLNQLPEHIQSFIRHLGLGSSRRMFEIWAEVNEMIAIKPKDVPPPVLEGPHVSESSSAEFLINHSRDTVVEIHQYITPEGVAAARIIETRFYITENQIILESQFLSFPWLHPLGEIAENLRMALQNSANLVIHRIEVPRT